MKDAPLKKGEAYQNPANDKVGFSSAIVKWNNVGTDQKTSRLPTGVSAGTNYKNIDAGLYEMPAPESGNFPNFPMTGSHLVLIVLLLIAITAGTVIRLNQIDKEQGM